MVAFWMQQILFPERWKNPYNGATKTIKLQQQRPPGGFMQIKYMSNPLWEREASFIMLRF